MIGADSIIAAARAYLRVPYVHRGRSRRGLDCAGLVLAVARDLGLPYPQQKLCYRPWPDLALLDALLPQFCDPAPAAAPGCILRLTVAGRPQHLGIAATLRGEPSVIHVNAAIGRVVEHAVDRRTERRIVAAWQFQGAA